MSSPEPERITTQELIRRLREDDGPVIKGLCLSPVEPCSCPDFLGVDVTSPFPKEMLDFGMLCEALRYRASLEKLVVHQGADRDEDFDNSRIAAGIACLLVDPNTSIVDIQLVDLQLQAYGAKEIGKALGKNSTLETLFIMGCDVGNEGGRALAKGLRHNASIKSFTLRVDVLRDSVATAFANALLSNETLTELNLQQNDFSFAGLISIARALQDNTGLERLLLENSVDPDSEGEENTFGERDATVLSKLIKQNKTLKVIELDFSSDLGNVNARALEVLAGAIQTNTSLETLAMGNCMWDMSDAGANLFVEALRRNHTLREISDKIGTNRAMRSEIEKLLSYNRAGPVSARAKKTGECPPEWFEKDIPVHLTPIMFICLTEMSGAQSTSTLYHFVREHKSILALIKSCAETNSRKRKKSRFRY